MKWRKPKPEHVPQYVIDTTPENACRAWTALLKTLRHAISHAFIDAIPTPDSVNWQYVNPAGKSVYPALSARVKEQGRDKRSGQTGVYLDANNASDFEIIQKFGCETIHVELYDSYQDPIAGMSDEGTECWAALLDEELIRLRELLRGQGISSSEVFQAGKDRPNARVRHN